MAHVITRDQVQAIAPGVSPEDTIADLNLAAFQSNAPYAFKAIAFSPLGVTTAWEMNPSLAKVIRENPGILGPRH